MKKNDRNIPTHQEETKLTENREGENTLSLFSRPEDEAFPSHLLDQINLSLPFYCFPESWRAQMASAGGEALLEMDPKDPIEGMLMTQMITTHNAMMECYRLGAHENLSIEQRANHVNSANKLIRSYSMLLDSLQKYKGRNHHEQRITVQHIQVSNGGQAIVGDINKPDDKI